MAADDGLSGAGVGIGDSHTWSPEWIDGLPHCDDRCARYDGKRCRVLGFPPGRAVFCEPTLIGLHRRSDELRTAARALVAKLEAFRPMFMGSIEAREAYKQIAPELAAVRKALGDE